MLLFSLENDRSNRHDIIWNDDDHNPFGQLDNSFMDDDYKQIKMMSFIKLEIIQLISI